MDKSFFLFRPSVLISLFTIIYGITLENLNNIYNLGVLYSFLFIIIFFDAIILFNEIYTITFDKYEYCSQEKEEVKIIDIYDCYDDIIKNSLSDKDSMLNLKYAIINSIFFFFFYQLCIILFPQTLIPSTYYFTYLLRLWSLRRNYWVRSRR